MIETCNKSLQYSIKDSWKKSYNLLAPHYTDFFFEDIYKPENGYANMIDGKCAASLVRIPLDMLFNGVVMKASVLKAPCVNPEFRNGEDVLKPLSDCVIDACEHTELVTLIHSSEVKPLEKYGFFPFYYRSAYTLTREDLQRITNFGCAYEPKPLDMLKVYSVFIRHFNGFAIRRLEDFSNLKRSIGARNGKIVAYYDAKDQIQGYANILLESREEAVITECVYLNSTALNKLLNAALQERPRIKVLVSMEENFNRLYPNAKKESFASYYLKVNNASLLSRQLNQKIYSPQDLAQFSRGPLYFTESY